MDAKRPLIEKRIVGNEGGKNGRCTFWRSCTKCTTEWVFLARAVFLLSFICFFHCVMRRTRRSFHPTADRLLLPLEFLIRAVSFDGSRVARSSDSPIRRESRPSRRS